MSLSFLPWVACLHCHVSAPLSLSWYFRMMVDEAADCVFIRCVFSTKEILIFLKAHHQTKIFLYFVMLLIHLEGVPLGNTGSTVLWFARRKVNDKWNKKIHRYCALASKFLYDYFLYINSAALCWVSRTVDATLRAAKNMEIILPFSSNRCEKYIGHLNLQDDHYFGASMYKTCFIYFLHSLLHLQ